MEIDNFYIDCESGCFIKIINIENSSYSVYVSINLLDLIDKNRNLSWKVEIPKKRNVIKIPYNIINDIKLGNEINFPLICKQLNGYYFNNSESSIREYKLNLIL